jgi:hypothetical protein
MGYFDFAMGTGIYPKESRIAAAKRAAVGGKRKRCTKGKNCSAACIAANMVCLVDLPWVGSALTKAKAQIQAAKGKAPAQVTPAAKAAPAPAPKAQAAPAPAPAPAPQKIPTWQKEQNVKKMLVTPAEQEKQLKFNLKVAQNKGTPAQIAEAKKQLKDFQDKQKAAAPQPAAATPKKKAIDKIPTVEQYKNWGVVQLESAIDNLKNSPNFNPNAATSKKAIGNMEEAVKQLKAEAAAKAPIPTPKPAAKPITVHDVAYYKKLGLPFLENMLPTAEAGSAAQTPDGKKVIANIKKAISELQTQPAPAAPKPAAAATPAAKAPPAKTPAPAKATSGLYTNWDTDQLVKFQNNFISSDPIKYKAAIDEIQQELDARGYKKPAPPAAKSTTASANQPQPASSSNPHGLSKTQQKIWNKAFAPITDKWFRDYADIAGENIPQTALKQQNRLDELRMLKLLKVAQNNNFTKGLRTIFDQVKVNDKNSQLTEEQLQKLPSSVRSLVQQFGQSKLKRMLIAVNDFTGNDYGLIRNAMRGRPPESWDKNLSPEDLKKKIDKYKRKGELIQEFLKASRNRPAVPKFRGVPMDDDKLNMMIQLSKNGGSFKEEAMNSWSTKNTTAKSFTYPKGTAKNRVIFRTVNKLGSSVKSVSEIPFENELLTPAGARYKVVGYTAENIKSGANFEKIHFFDVVEY